MKSYKPHHQVRDAVQYIRIPRAFGAERFPDGARRTLHVLGSALERQTCRHLSGTPYPTFHEREAQRRRRFECRGTLSRSLVIRASCSTLHYLLVPKV